MSADKSDAEDDSDSQETILDEVRPNDPILVTTNLLKSGIFHINIIHEKYDQLPGWIRISFGAGTFLFSIYFGKYTRNLISSFAAKYINPFFGEIIHFSFGIQVVLLLLIFLTIQTSIVNYRLNVIENIFTSDRIMDDRRVAPDGGRQLSSTKTSAEIDSSGAGVLGGAATGAVIGASFGPPGVVGGAILGAILGDEVEKSSIKSRNKREIKSKIVNKLLRKRIIQPQYISVEEVVQWFPSHEKGMTRQIIYEMTREESTPIVQRHRDRIALTSSSEGTEYLSKISGKLLDESE